MLKNSDLIYSYEEPPGIKRLRRGKGYAYYDPEGALIKNEEEKMRLNALAVPPSYENVWFCPLPNGHLQATGYDTKSNKQYFYHQLYRQMQEAEKYHALNRFAEKLPKIRRSIDRTLGTMQDIDKKNVQDKQKILAAMVRVLDRTGIRVGNEEATKKNHTYGLTTLRKKHFAEEDDKILFQYEGKGGVEIERRLNDAKVEKILDYCSELPGQSLFQYENEKGEGKTISSQDLNSFIKNLATDDFSAKDFRTWRFCCLFTEEALRQKGRGNKPTLTSVLETIAELTGNTPAILKKSYIHPGLLQIVKEGDWQQLKTDKDIDGLRRYETVFAHYLRTKHARGALEALKKAQKS